VNDWFGLHKMAATFIQVIRLLPGKCK